MPSKGIFLVELPELKEDPGVINTHCAEVTQGTLRIQIQLPQAQLLFWLP